MSLLKTLYYRWKYRRLANSIHACLEGGTTVRELQELGALMREVGEMHNIESLREEGERIEANAEAIVLERGIKFIETL